MKLKKIIVGAIAAVSVLHLLPSFAHEIETHEKMSTEAAAQSLRLNENLTNLGLNSIKNSLTTNGISKSALEWIGEGAKREDDTRSEVFFRYTNHFYDPFYKTGFGGILFRNSGFMSGMPSPDWALIRGPAEGQLYSFPQARKYLYDGLIKEEKVDRDSNLGLVFRTMGQLAHLVQDTAQPQHTRNNGHADESTYELYTKDNLVNLKYLSAPIPSIAKARDIFTNDAGTGMAQYANRNFVSAGTNFLGKAAKMESFGAFGSGPICASK